MTLHPAGSSGVLDCFGLLIAKRPRAEEEQILLAVIAGFAG
jgi:hypothetical protein